MTIRKSVVLVSALGMSMLLAPSASAHVSVDDYGSSNGCGVLDCYVYIGHTLESLPDSTYCIGSYGSYVACRVRQTCHGYGRSTVPGTVSVGCTVGANSCAIALADDGWCETTRSGYSGYITSGSSLVFHATATITTLTGTTTAQVWDVRVCVDSVGAFVCG